jgi:predicted dehydrogenase
MTCKTRYALAGLGIRGIHQFALPLLGKGRPGVPSFRDRAELVGILDPDRERVRAFLNAVDEDIPWYPANATARMLKETQADILLVAGTDASHCKHILKGLEAGCDVIVEKPMVIHSRDVLRVQEAEKRCGRKVRVAHNLRYTPTHRRLKRLILDGRLGRIVNVEFTYNLDTWHGSSYFYRWNRERAQSGGLSIHKSCHHFDLINWWLDDVPETVFALGGLDYYGPEGALRPRDKAGAPLDPVEERRRCPVFQKHYADKDDPLRDAPVTGWDPYDLPYGFQYPPGERRYLYDEAVTVEDHYHVTVRYRGGAALTYSCNFCTPWEGYILGINGTRGRVEITHRSDPDPTGITQPVSDTGRIVFYPLFGGKEVIEVPPAHGGHGGADSMAKEDLFGTQSDESRELDLVAGSRVGGHAIAMGEAVVRSIRSGRSVPIPKGVRDAGV